MGDVKGEINVASLSSTPTPVSQGEFMLEFGAELMLREGGR